MTSMPVLRDRFGNPERVPTTDVAPTLTEGELYVLADGDQYGMLGLTVYLAARYTRREELLTYREDLIARGHRVPARWLHGDHQVHGTENNRLIEAEGPVPVDQAVAFAEDDLTDISNSDVLVVFTEEARTGPTRGGRHVEYGYGLAMHRLQRRLVVVTVGPVENVFHAVDDVVRLHSWEGFLSLLDSTSAHPCGRIPRYSGAPPCPLHPWHRFGPIDHSLCCPPGAAGAAR